MSFADIRRQNAAHQDADDAWVATRVLLFVAVVFAAGMVVGGLLF